MRTDLYFKRVIWYKENMLKGAREEDPVRGASVRKRSERWARVGAGPLGTRKDARSHHRGGPMGLLTPGQGDGRGKEKSEISNGLVFMWFPGMWKSGEEVCAGGSKSSVFDR